jgi:hypothetical protein
MTTLTASSGNGRCNAFAPSHDARIQTSRQQVAQKKKPPSYPQNIHSLKGENLCGATATCAQIHRRSLASFGSRKKSTGAERIGVINSGRTRAVGCPMRDEFASYSFRAVTIAGLVLLCSGLVAIAFT